MASFSLRSQRTGQYKHFSLLEVLKLLGDKVNDEIWLEDGEDVYNLSSFIEMNGGQPSGNYPLFDWRRESPDNINGLSQFSLDLPPYNGILMVFLNGLCQKVNQDYFLQNQTIQFPFAMNSQDTLLFFYEHQII